MFREISVAVAQCEMNVAQPVVGFEQPVCASRKNVRRMNATGLNNWRKMSRRAHTSRGDARCYACITITIRRFNCDIFTRAPRVLMSTIRQ